MPEPPPDPDERLLNAHNQPREPKPRPPKVARTPTRKEFVIPPPAPGGKDGKRVRRPTMVERIVDDPGDTTEIVPSFRPRLRPPMALLTILDDGRDEGEEMRLRAAVTAIGRAQGDVTIPHDERVSGRHAEIRREFDGGRWTWTVADLGSTNGTFVRVHKCSIKPGQEMMVGHSRFRFEDGSPPGPTAVPTQMTAAWQSVAMIGAALVEITSQGDGRRWPLADNEATIGRKDGCTIVLDDPMIGDRHVRLWRDERGWRLESRESRDGVWIRIEKPVTVDRTCSFQLGEQRFVLKVL